MTPSTTRGNAAATQSRPHSPSDPPPVLPALSPGELLRWVWRQLTSMRTALILLLLLALAATPGSFIPQENIDAAKVRGWQKMHPTLTPLFDHLGMFNVFKSAWFSAVYLLLMVSVVGCIVPRLIHYSRAIRARPPRTPRNLRRLPAYTTITSPLAVDAALAQAHEILQRRRFRTDQHPGSISAERGYLREAGNLLFHLSIIVVLIGFAYGSLFGYKGAVIVVVGQNFSNSTSQYDDLSTGALFDTTKMDPFTLDIDTFKAKFLTSGPQLGLPVAFSSNVTYATPTNPTGSHYRLSVNHPLTIGGTSVFLVGHGYAPRITVRDGSGDIAYSGPVVFLPQDSSFESFGVLKVPDARPKQLGFEGLFLPTYGYTRARGPFSAFPDALNPAVSILGYQGDLGMGSGRPQSVYTLDKTNMSELKKPDGSPDRIDLTVGRTKALPGGGSIRLDGVDRWVRLQVSKTPGKLIVLAGVLAGLLGLLASLFIRPRRVWITATIKDGQTVVEIAGLDRSPREDLGEEIDTIARLLRPQGATP